MIKKLTNINYCDICKEKKGKENIKVIEFKSSQESFHLNYCRNCFEKEFPEYDWDQVEDKREFMEQAKEKAIEILSKKDTNNGEKINMTREEMFCPFCAGDDVREVDNRIDDLEPIFRCSDCGKFYLVETYYKKDGHLISEEEYLGQTEN